MTDTHLSDTRFSDLDLPEPLMRGIEATGFTHCTPIQALSLPLLLKDTDVAGQAQTGTGKTAAFLLAAFARLLRNEPSESRHKTQPRAVILAPTRELAIQIYNDAKELGRHTGFKMVLVYGGTGYDSQRKELIDGVDILIGTPGRIIDYYNQGVFDLSLTEVAILDEADRMFDLGFIKDVRFMLRRMPEPEKRLNMLFSATLSHRVAELAYEHMNEPTEVQVETENLTADNVKERMYYPSNDEKTPLLLGILRDIKAERVVVFVNTKHVTERLDDWLKMNDFKSGVISGDVPQKKRERLLEQFKEGSVRVLVATDVAARGLHIPNVSHVINFDLPQDAEDYVHRVGRTARAGASGEAISFACEKYAFSLMDIEKYVGHQLPVESVEPELMMLDAKRPAERERSRRGGRNDSRGGSRSRSGPPARGRDSRSGGATRERRPSQSGERTSPPRSSESGGGPRDGGRDLNAEDRLHRERRPGRGARKAQTAESAESKIDTQPDSEKPTKPRGRVEPEIPAIG